MVVFPSDRAVFAGNSVLLTCVGYGMPRPSLSWWFEGETITGDGPQISVVESMVTVGGIEFVWSSLLLCNVSQEDHGNYSCSASNSVREPDSVNFTIAIQSESH